MFSPFLRILLATIVAGVIFYGVSRLIKGRPLTIIGIILGVMFLLYTIRTSHLLPI